MIYQITEAQRQQLLDVSLASLSMSAMIATKLLQSLAPVDAEPAKRERT
jgi:hypothetical protein